MKYDGPESEIVRDGELSGIGSLVYIGSVRVNSKKLCIFHCKLCAKDEELFGTALFGVGKGDFERGQNFCGCGKAITWTLQQAVVKSERVCRETGNIFKGIILPYIGVSSRCNLYCSKCEHSWTSKLSNLWALKRGCPSCRNTKFNTVGVAASRRADADVIEDFLKTGKFHPETKFVKIKRKAKNSKNNYWRLYCPRCNTTAECQQGHLLSGTTSCACSFFYQRESYINLIKDGEDIIALKFGVSRDSHKRMITHQYSTLYTVEMYAIFKYGDSKSCRLAEQECKDTLICSVISKESFRPGWTETTYSNNLDKIISIFKSYGGIRIY